MATVDLGKVRITFGGPFNSSQTYEKLTIVDGPFNVKYISVNDVPAGSSLSDTNYWTPLSGQFVEQYQGSHAVAPTSRNGGGMLQAGDLYFDVTLNEMRVYDGYIWKSAGSPVNGTSKRQTFTGDGTTTTFTIAGGYDPTFADVYLNGVKLVNGQDVDVSSGTDVVFTTAPAAGDVIDVVAYGVFRLADIYTKAEIDQNHYTKAEIDQGQVVLNAIKQVDGPGSGLDADTVDGIDSTAIALKSDVYNKTDIDSGAVVLNAIKQVDGPGSGLDADLFRGHTPDTLPAGLGVGQTWQDVTASRSLGVTYTNTTGKPIMVIITRHGVSGYGSVFYIDGVAVISTNEAEGDPYPTNEYAIVPNGSTYKCVVNYGSGLIQWFELR